jgi:NTP pyrophosphatase (non-canonical NTP hydrolase)
MSLADMLANYLTVRQHTLSTAHLTGADQLRSEAEYVRGEARELVGEVAVLCDRLGRGGAREATALKRVRHELADVVLAATALAGMLPGGATVEDCIAEKTEADRGRG